MATESPRDDPLAAHLDLIERVIDFLCRKKRLSEDDRDELTSYIYGKLADNDRAILRKFEGRSRLETYLTTVVRCLYLDWRNARWGKWRPSSAARDLGPVAILLEQLLTRDGFSLDEACRLLRDNHRVSESRDELEAMAAQFPPRIDRRAAGGETAEGLTVAGAAPDDAMIAAERTNRRVRAVAALGRVLAELPPEDGVILRMRYRDGFQIAAIARALGLPQKPLYRRIERLLRELRQGLVEREGVTAAEVRELLRGGWEEDERGGKTLFRVRPTGREGGKPGENRL